MEEFCPSYFTGGGGGGGGESLPNPYFTFWGGRQWLGKKNQDNF